jgi:hypothetical protein
MDVEYRIDACGRMASMIFDVQKMPRLDTSAVRHFHQHETSSRGLRVAAERLDEIASGVQYPPAAARRS